MSRGRRPERAAFDRRQWYGSGAGAGQDTGIIFESQLLTTLVPQQGGGDRTPTFTRATTATVMGYASDAVAGASQVLLTVASGEARFQGARRVSEGVWSAILDDGSYIPTADLKGYLAEGARTNSILQSNTLGTTWTISNAADMEAVSADQYVSVDGATTMDKLQPKATTAVHSLDQAFTFTAAKYTCAADLRYVAATPQRWVALILNDGTTTWGASFDLLNGVVGVVSAGATSGIETTGQANVYRVWVTNTANAAAAAGTVKISLNATDTATLESAARAGTETLGAGMVQLEVGEFKSSRITTTTVAVARNADVLTYAFIGNANSAVGACYAEVTYAADKNFNMFVATNTVQATGAMLYGSALAELLLVDSANQISAVGATMVPGATVQKIASSWGPSGVAPIFARNGTGYTGSPTFSGNIGSTILAIGTRSAADDETIFGTIRNVRIYSRALSDAQLQAMTS